MKNLKIVTTVGLLVLSFVVMANPKSDCETVFSQADKDLLIATKNRDLSGFISAIRQGADINVRDKKGKTALIHASEAGRADIVRQLIDRTQADPNIQDNKGRTALIHATKQGHKDVSSILLDSGADSTIQDNKGRTAKEYESMGEEKSKNRQQDYDEIDAVGDIIDGTVRTVGRLIDSIF